MAASSIFPVRVKSSQLRGFTLIEILVVLIIISISTGMILLSVDVTGHQKARGFVRDMTFMMRYLSDEAILTGRPHAMQFNRKAKTITPVVASGLSWGAIKDVDVLTWDESIKIKLIADGVELEEEESGNDDTESGFLGSGFEKKKQRLPRVLFHAIGMWEPAGELEIIIDSIPYMKVTWGASGKTETEYMDHDEDY